MDVATKSRRHLGRRLPVILAGVVLSLWTVAIVGCLQGGEEPASSATVLIFKHGKLSGDATVLPGLLREFEQRHPGLIVREELLPASSDRQHQYYAMNLDGGSAPFDVLAIDTIWVQEFAQAGWIGRLDDIVPMGERAAFFPSAVAAATFGGQLYAVPWYIDAGMLYYRRDLLDRYGLMPPSTWDDLVHAATVIVDAEQDRRLSGFVWQGKQYEGLICTTLDVLRSYGADLWTGDLDQAERGLQFLRDTIAMHKVSPPSTSMADEESTRHFFGDGQAVFMRNWPYAWPLLQRQGSPVRGKIGMAPLPSVPGHAGAPVLGGWLLAVAEQSSRREAAGELVRFLTSPDIQRAIAIQLGYNPARRALYSDASVLDARPELMALYPTLLQSQPRPVTPSYILLSQAAQPEISALVVGRKTPRAVLDAVRRQADRYMGGGAASVAGARQ
ncbi:MAG: ABC transporter substrate-binding protein [Nitrospira sp.]|nr:ABC transporter substrate-binding protein [Nitrospira sp.]